METELPGYWKTHELAKRLQVNESTIRRWIQAGELRAYKLGRIWLVPDEEAERLIAEKRARWR